MAATPETGALSPDCRVWAYPNLFVVDGSFMPTSGGVNPSLTITANDGPSRTFSLNDETVVRGKAAPAQSDQVVAVTLNGSSTAHAVLVLSGDGSGPRGGHYGWRR